MRKLTTVAKIVFAGVLAMTAFAGEADARYRAKQYGQRTDGKYVLYPSELMACVRIYNQQGQHRANMQRLLDGSPSAYNTVVDRYNAGVDQWNSQCGDRYYYTSDLPSGVRIDDLQGMPDPIDQ
jgi:hypothetical protein